MPRDGSATRARLLAAATTVVQRVGYASATTRLISEEAGVAEGTLYRHFPGKAGLFLSAVLEQAGGALAELEDLPSRAGQETVHDVLVDALARLSAVRDAVLPLELASLTDPELARLRDARLADPADRGPRGPVEDYLRAEQQRGRVRADLDCGAAADVLLTLLFGMSLHTTGGPDRAVLAAALDVVLRGVVTAP